MGGFREHSIGGVITAVICVVIMYLLNFNNVDLLSSAFFLCIFGSWLPDIDSDHSSSFDRTYEVICVLTAFTIGLILWSLFGGIGFMIGGLLGSYMVLVFGVKKLVQKVSRHRGITHSIPMVLLYFLVINQMFLMDTATAVVDGAVVAMVGSGGTLSHLVVDELFSLRRTGRFSFEKKKSWGTAMKLLYTTKKDGISKSSYVMVVAVIAMVTLNVVTYMSL